MHQILKAHHPVRHIKSFKYAFQGIFHALINEPNFRIQLFAATVSAMLGFFYKISTTEWSILIISMGLLLMAELVNTVVEEFIDVLIKEYHEGAKVIKDMSAGFVLITAAVAAINLGLIFGPKILF